MTDINYAFPPMSVVSLPISGSLARFPVRRIFCVGRNYAAHAIEMGVKPDKSDPFYFLKSAECVVESGATVPYPPATQNYHHEMELVVAIGSNGFQVPVELANEIVFGYACGLDMTRRDLQLSARDKGRPWDLGKNFEQSAVLSPVIPVAHCGHLTRGRIELKVNGVQKQQADLADLINSVPELIADLSRYYHLGPGDLIFTGTPEGVGPVHPGDLLEGSIDKVGNIWLKIRE